MYIYTLFYTFLLKPFHLTSRVWNVIYFKVEVSGRRRKHSNEDIENWWGGVIILMDVAMKGVFMGSCTVKFMLHNHCLEEQRYSYM